jgi:AraC-like DNA-binding protein
MPKTRHSQRSREKFDGALLRTFAVDFLKPQQLIYPTPGWDRLIHATQGVISVSAANNVWVLPTHQALWVPAGLPHEIKIATPAQLRSIYLRQNAVPKLPRHYAVLAVTPFLDAIIAECARLGALLARKPAHRRLASVFQDQLHPASGEPLQVPQPKDPRAQRFAKLLKQSPPATPLEILARQSGASLRTLERLFAADLGITLAAWRRRHRLQTALELLAAQSSVADAADLCGYSSPSAFIHMFRREFGVTPSRYFQRPNHQPRRQQS